MQVKETAIFIGCCYMEFSLYIIYLWKRGFGSTYFVLMCFYCSEIVLPENNKASIKHFSLDELLCGNTCPWVCMTATYSLCCSLLLVASWCQLCAHLLVFSRKVCRQNRCCGNPHDWPIFLSSLPNCEWRYSGISWDNPAALRYDLLPLATSPLLPTTNQFQ